MLNAPELAITIAPDIPRNATAAGITIDPPKTTSIISFNDADVSPLSAISSESFMNDAYVTIAPKPKLKVKNTCPAAAIHTFGMSK